MPILTLEDIKARCVIDEKTGCWIWQNCTNADGYPIASRKGAVNKHVARISFEMMHESKPTKKLKRKCGNILCVNPDHIYEFFGKITQLPLSEIRSKSIIDVETGCWLWNGRLKKGYPVINISGKEIAVHRLAFIHYTGKTPRLIHRICRSSKSKLCVNPQHLITSKQADSLNEIRDRCIVNEHGCWVFTGHLNKWGYGIIRVENKTRLVHRMAFYYATGKLPECVCHNCPGGDNPACVNPEHLWAGDNKSNRRDSGYKETQSCKLSWEKVAEIRRSDGSDSTIASFSDIFNVTEHHIREILNGDHWDYPKPAYNPCA